MKNLLSLHEAIVLALIQHPTRTDSFDNIARFIEKRNLYPNRKGGIPLAKQVMLRSTKSQGGYHHLFEEIGAEYIRLRDSYANYPFLLFSSLETILKNHHQLYKTDPKKIRVRDEKMNSFRHVTFSTPYIICITTKDGSGEKKYIYIREINLKGDEIIGIYSINGNLENLRMLFDPLSHYLAPVSDGALVNVSYYDLTSNKVLKPLFEIKESMELPPFKFSASQAAKEYLRIFQVVQESYQHRISFEKSILDWKNQFPDK